MSKDENNLDVWDKLTFLLNEDKTEKTKEEIITNLYTMITLIEKNEFSNDNLKNIKEDLLLITTKIIDHKNK